MARFFWLYAFGIVWAGRLSQLLALYFAEAPLGGPLVDRWYRFFPHALIVETGYLAFFLLLFVLADSRLFARLPRLVPYVWGVFAGFYLLLSGGNDEVMRWLGQHVTWGYLKTYVLTSPDADMLGRLFAGGSAHFALSFALVFITIFASAWFLRRFAGQRAPVRWSQPALLILLVLAVAGMTSRYWFGPSKSRWERIQPLAYTLYSDVVYGLHVREPADFAEGIRFLGGDPEQEFPFWKTVNNEDSVFSAFRERPFSERPDVVVMVIESLRGWSCDMRVEQHCALLPNICRLSRNSAYFPNTHSVGFPSVEGLVGLQLGIWSHPSKMTLVNRLHMPMRSLSDILGQAGYYRELLTATEPSFDNLVPWFQKWFDYHEYKPENQHDVPLADRFAARYAERPQGQPLFLNWYSTTTHLPFSMPEGYGPDPDDLGERYQRVLAYMDSAVGLVLDAVQRYGRPENTIVILTGDHAIPNRSQALLGEALGSIHEGHTWVPLLISAPGLPPFLDSLPVSHADIAPTLLSLLNLNVNNHFVGHDLRNGSGDGLTLSFRQKGIQLKRDSLSLYTFMEDTSVRVAQLPVSPSWQVRDFSEGFVRGTEQSVEDSHLELSRQVRSAARAWAYVMDRNKLSP